MSKGAASSVHLLLHCNLFLLLLPELLSFGPTRVKGKAKLLQLFDAFLRHVALLSLFEQLELTALTLYPDG